MSAPRTALDAQREAFEAWAKAQGLPLGRLKCLPDVYADVVTSDAWGAWQAAPGAWRAAQTQLAAALIPQPGGMLLTAVEVVAALTAAAAAIGNDWDSAAAWIARHIEAAVLQKQRAIFAANLALPAGLGDAP